MELTLILDKSAFQSLGYLELYRLCQYYRVIIPPILVTEILGDLSKEAKEGKPPSEQRVIEFAKKLFVNESVVIMDYRKIVHMDLMMHNIPLDRRPIVDVAKKSTMGNQAGFEIKESEEEKSINKWKQGQFSDAEKELSSKWRSSTTEPNVLDKLKKKLNHQRYGLKTIKEVVNKADSILNDPTKTQNLLLGLFENYEIPVSDALKILQDWNNTGKSTIKSFSKYAYHCLRIDLIFIIGLTENIIGTRSTNSVDIKYLYHLPFTKIFSSGDNLHKQIVPHILDDDQVFIDGNELKKDISSILTKINELRDEEKKEFYKKPPIDTNSFTFKLWRDFYGYTKEDALWEIEPTEEEIQRVKGHMQKITKSFESNINENVNIENADYFVKYSLIQKDDPCHCKSGNPLVGCCMTIEEFRLLSDISFFQEIVEGRIIPKDGQELPSKDEAKMIIQGLKDGTLKPKTN